MSTNNYIPTLLNLKDPNLEFTKVSDEIIKNIESKVIYAILINKPKHCSCCGGNHINIHSYKESTIKLMPISGMNALLKLKKQRYICKDCGKTFMAETNIVRKNCYISNNVKYAVALQATEKISEKDILSAIKRKDETMLRKLLTSKCEGVSEYMKTALKTSSKYAE